MTTRETVREILLRFFTRAQSDAMLAELSAPAPETTGLAERLTDEQIDRIMLGYSVHSGPQNARDEFRRELAAVLAGDAK